MSLNVNNSHIMEKRLIVTLGLMLILVMAVFGLNWYDPFYRTIDIIEGEIVSKTQMVGKTGSHFEVIVRVQGGDEYRFSKSQRFNGRTGDIATLRLYKRKITSLKKYELENITSRP